MEMRIAIPTKNGEIFQHFGQSQEFTVYEVESELVQSKEVLSTQGIEHGGVIGFLVSHSIHLVISGKIGGGAKSALRTRRIELITGIVGNADEILCRYLSGEELGNPELECNSYEVEHTYGIHGCVTQSI